jgi:hypothetical protein
MTNEKPVAKIRAGAVSCALWRNAIKVDGEPKFALKATIERRFRDAGGEWRSTQSFSRNEIALAIYVLSKALDWIIQQENEKGSSDSVEEVIM